MADISSAMKKALSGLLKEHGFLVFILLISSILLLARLGERNLGVDETWAAIHAENILINGYPLVSEGYGFVEHGTVPSHDSWLPFYVTAFSYLLFGVDAFASRLPFALFGLATIMLFFVVAQYISGKKSISVIATILLAFSNVFYVHARYSRYYTMVMFFVLLLLLSYLKLFESGKRRYDVLFIAANVLFFYTQIQLWAYAVVSLLFHFLAFSRSREMFKRLSGNAAIAMLFMLPWVYYWLFAQESLAKGVVSISPAIVLFKLALAVYYFSIIVFPVVFLLLLFRKGIRNVIAGKKFLAVHSLIIGKKDSQYYPAAVFSYSCSNPRFSLQETKDSCRDYSLSSHHLKRVSCPSFFAIEGSGHRVNSRLSAAALSRLY
jgi:4-amino-4-deoxy-L-arabinose transferase-like glycosyltransferase